MGVSVSTGVATVIVTWVLTAAACANSMEPVPTSPPLSGARPGQSANTITLAIGQELLVESAGLTLRFVKVEDDSRCPVDVTCVWAGDATVHLEARAKGVSPSALALHVAPERGQSAQVDRYVVTLVRLTPQPRSDKPISPTDYRAEISVSEARK